MVLCENRILTVEIGHPQVLCARKVCSRVQMGHGHGPVAGLQRYRNMLGVSPAALGNDRSLRLLAVNFWMLQDWGGWTLF